MAKDDKKPELTLDSRLNIKYPAAEIKELKMIALQNDITMSDLVRAAINEYKKKFK